MSASASCTGPMRPTSPSGTRLQATEWDLVVVDEAHRMSAHYDGDDVRETRRYKLGKLLASTTRHFLLLTATRLSFGTGRAEAAWQLSAEISCLSVAVCVLSEP